MHRRQVTGKKVIGAGEEHQTFGIGGGRGHLLQLSGRGELVAVSAEKELGNGAVLQGRIAVVMTVGLSGQAEGDESADVGAGLRVTTGMERHGCAEAEAYGNEGTVVFGFEPVECGEDVGGFGTAVVGSLAEASAAKVEAEDGKGESPGGIVEGLHGVVDNFVVEVAAVKGMGMADERGKGSVGCAFVQKGFKTADGAGQIQTAQ